MASQNPQSIITSMFDNDFYKFTMQNAVIKLFPYAHAKYRFINRGNHEFPEGFAAVLQEEVNKMAALKLSQEEYVYLQKQFSFLDPTYLDFLKGFQYAPSEVKIEQNGKKLEVHIQGLWYRTILWEVPILSLISELYYKIKKLERGSDSSVTAVVKTKMDRYKRLGIKIAEFGTRRRYSYWVQDLVINTLKMHGGNSFSGTSNVALAKKYGVKAIGTHAHEWFMFHAAKYGYKMANIVALENWVDVYRGDLGIALSDTYTSDVFFESFDNKFSKLFDGVRHDSGDPIEFAKKTIRHYQKLNINPLTKTIIFSDALTPDKVVDITDFCKGKIQMSFGIGTNFTNDVGVEPMNIVIKMSDAKPKRKKWMPVVKLSDVAGKYTGTEEEIQLSKIILGLENVN